jgi:type VI secretion system secreted protein VgrG
VGKAQALTIVAEYQVSVGAAMNERIGSDKQVQVGATVSETIGKDLRLIIGNDGRFAFGRNWAVNAGGSVTIEAEDQLTVKCGQASIVLKKNGDISITGKEVSIKASGDIVLKGQKIIQN